PGTGYVIGDRGGQPELASHWRKIRKQAAAAASAVTPPNHLNPRTRVSAPHGHCYRLHLTIGTAAAKIDTAEVTMLLTYLWFWLSSSVLRSHICIHSRGTSPRWRHLCYFSELTDRAGNSGSPLCCWQRRT